METKKSKKKEFEAVRSSLIEALQNINPDGDLSDIGNEVGNIVSKHFKNKPIGYDQIDFMAGIKHGISLNDRTHDNPINETLKLREEACLVSAIITDSYMDSLYKLLDIGYIGTIYAISEVAEAWCQKFRKEILDPKTEWDIISETNKCSDWEELVLKFTHKYMLKKYNIKIKISK